MATDCSRQQFSMSVEPLEAETTSMLAAEEISAERGLVAVCAQESRSHAGPMSKVVKTTLWVSAALLSVLASTIFLLNHQSSLQGRTATAILGRRGEVGPVQSQGALTQLRAAGAVDGVRRLDNTSMQMCAWLRVHEGKNRKCKGAEDSDGGFEEHPSIPSAEECRILCMNNLDCKGIQYDHHTGLCHIWTEEIESSEEDLGFECDRCMRIAVPETTDKFGNAFGEDFELIDGSVNRECTSQHHHAAFHFSYNLVSVTSLEHCQELCLEFTTCKGIDYTEQSGLCKEWEVDVDGSKEHIGMKCMKRKAYHFESVDGGDDRACRRNSPTDDDPSYYKADIYNTVTVKDCKHLCLIDRECKGIEWRQYDGRCEIWTVDPYHSENKHGFHCFRKTSTHADDQ